MSTGAAYSGPIEEALAQLGTGDAGGTTQVWTSAAAALTPLAGEQATSVATLDGAWQGPTSESALGQSRTVQAATETLAESATAAAAAVAAAGDAVRAARTEVQGILDAFLAWADTRWAATGQDVGLQQRVREQVAGRAASDALSAAQSVERAGGALSQGAATLAGLADVTVSAAAVPVPVENGPPLAPSTPAPVTTQGAAVPTPGAAAAAASPGTLTGGSTVGASDHPTGGGSGGAAGGSGGGGSGGGSGGAAGGPSLPQAPPLQPGTGVDVNLPDGSTVQAPSEQAAAAVRNALTQLGVPYVWGASNPGVGMDCSGLTSWAYGEAGVELPRHSAAQAIGMSVSPDAVLPGDLVVWNGHVAMVVGPGQMVEAGDPVEVSAIRTSNMGDPFLGFYRPAGAAA